MADRNTAGSQIVSLMNQSHLNQPGFVRLMSRLVIFICLTAANLIAQESKPQAAVSVHLDEQEPFRAAEAGFEISRNDLLSGVRFQSNLKLQSGTVFGMTDGSGGHRIFAAANEQGDPWVVEYSDLRIQQLEEIRVFSWNRDTRARQDYDVAVSSDGGSTWQLVATRVTAKKSGALAVTRVVASFDAVTNLRFTFRQVHNNTHSAILEIDALGEKIPVPTIEELRSEGKKFSKYLDPKALAVPDGPPKANLTAFQHEIKPLLEASCVKCHGPDKQKGKFRVDTLDPDMINGEDGAWWVEVTDTISQGEMPPPDEEDVELADADRAKVVDWISQELLVASQSRRSEQGHTSFRRLTRYETSYALQDLLGLPYDFARDLPPETESEDGFQNSSEMLQMTSAQFETYREIAHTALSKATVRGEQPEPVRYVITGESAEANFQKDRLSSIEKLRKKTDADSQAKLAELEKVAWTYDANKAHFVNLETGRGFPSRSGYGRNSFRPLKELRETPEVSNYVLALPGNTQQILDFGDFLPGSGTLLLRVRAWQSSTDSPSHPDLRIHFGYQPSNNSKTSFRVGEWTITSTSDSPEFYEMDLHLGEISRNAFRGKHPLGKRPNPSEYLVFQNLSSSGIHIDYIEVTAPHYDQWPPESHQRVFAAGVDPESNPRKILSDFMRRAWRRPATELELDKKLALFNAIRQSCDDAQQAMLEVLATVISSPNFLYIVQSPEPENFDLATRLAMFLWSSVPDEELLHLAEVGRLSDTDTLAKQVDRMLVDERSARFSHHFVRQWLGLALLDYQKVEENLREAMGQEPIELFAEILRQDSNILDFLHSDYTMLNEKLANHYGINDVFGSEFRRVDLQPESRRGGILTQAGLLAMNADGKHSHPLKRGIWLLENILHDPPPPPPPAVPEIDLADPRILKMTLKERMADHRDDPACASCHEKIDPWGIAFENYDALGKWRSEDSVGVLFNGDKLQGMDGLKRYLLELRQDQFARAMTHKLTSYALGRPMSFGDRTSLEQITAKTRRDGDGLKTLIRNIILSNLFNS